ncbi:MAG: MBL fold metallo-hydrolase [Deltaproteobacteria bacterium]|nr:MBL fold metallo-hydrolase [Deltaproteobacteria bacterium]MBW2086348.1 MBL fold metallo-hydrolase [Deltaproteobacteria bacterium]
MIVTQILVGQFAVFCYLIGCEATHEALVIDPAGDEDRIKDAAQEAGLNIKYIFNTHGHPDHTCGNARMKEITGAAIVMHALDDDIFNIKGNARMASVWGLAQSPPADIRLDQEKTFRVGQVNLEIIHTPGHTPGGLCLLGEGQLFTGDTLFVGSGGRTDLPYGSLSALLDSIKKLMALPDDTVIWPGHDYGDVPTSTIGREKKTNVYVVEFDLLEE